MTDQKNILQTIKTAIQDFMASDVHELKVRAEAQRDQVASLERRMDDKITNLEHRMDDRFKNLEQRMEDRFKAVDDRFLSLERHIDDCFDAGDVKAEAQTKAILAAIAQSKAENESLILRQIAALTERVAALEATRH